MSCNIAVAVAGEGVVYPCAVGRSVGWAKEHIRDTFNITGGSVLCDGVGADEGDLIEVGKVYTFFGGSIPGKKYHLYPLPLHCFLTHITHHIRKLLVAPTPSGRSCTT